MAGDQNLTLLLLLLSAPISLLLLIASCRRCHRRSFKGIHRPEAPISLPPPPPPLPLEEVDGGDSGQDGEHKIRRRKGRKKKHDGIGGAAECGENGGGIEIGSDEKGRSGAKKDGVDESMYPFSSFASATQRKIKLQYDQLVKSNQAKALTMAQVGQFVNCLVEARNELQHKSDVIKRSFKIKKALLLKADRSSFDRLCQQLYKLEAEHRRLEEDAAVYNLLQEQLKLSPAYKTMLELSTSIELKDKLDQPTEFADISFEEFLAQEKKDSFWLRNGKLRSCAS